MPISEGHLDGAGPDDVLFAGEGSASGGRTPSLADKDGAEALAPWRVLVVDDDPEILRVTQLVLQGFSYNGRGVEMAFARTRAEAVAILHESPPFAVALVDVVMEEDDAGLKLVNHIRQVLGDKEVRVILRTGQPGRAPESRVIIDYDINDYKEKTELSSQKLATCIIAALRSYEHIQAISQLNANLERKVLERTAALDDSNRRLLESLERLREDEEAGRIIQFKLLPEHTKSFGEYEFSRYLMPSMYLSGDFVDYFEIADGLVGFYIADVSGHGASSAFVTVLLKSLVNKSLELHRIGVDMAASNPAALLAKLNAEILRERLDKYLTIFYGVIDTRRNHLTFSSGGQFPTPLLYVGDSEAQFMDAAGVPVGIFDFATFDNHQMRLPGDFVLALFSDGVLDVLPGKKIVLKEKYLVSLIDNFDVTTPGLAQAMELDKAPAIPDDITFLMVKRRSAPHV